MALLLPLTGAPAGLTEGMAAAAAPLGPEAEQTYRLETFDTGGTPDGAAAAAHRAVAAGAVVILGPLFAREVAPVVAAAGAIPVIAFSNDSAIAGAGAHLFGLTPLQSVMAIFAYARQQGVRRVAIIAQDRPWGRQSIIAARGAASRYGLTLEQIIIEDASNDATALPQQLRQNGTPDAVLLPDGGPGLAVLAQALAGSGLQILGTSQWIELDLAAIPALHGAWFAGPVPIDGQQRQSGVLTALAHDAAIVAAALVSGGVPSKASLQRSAGFPTTLGRVRFQADGTVERDLSILGIDSAGAHILVKAAA